MSLRARRARARGELTRDECEQLDAYLREHRPGFLGKRSVLYAFDHQEEYNLVVEVVDESDDVEDDVEDDEEEEGNPFVEDQAEEAVEEDEDDEL